MVKRLILLTIDHILIYFKRPINMNTLTINTPIPETTHDVLNDKAAPPNNTFNALNILTSIEADRIAWEQGVYLISNQALYSVLSKCLAFCGELPTAEAKQRSADLEAFFKERGYKYKKESPLVTRAVKAIFGNIDRRRVSTYSLVLRRALKEGIGASNLAEWIEANRGIQEIRLGHSATFVSPKAKAEKARQIVQGRSFLSYATSELLSMEADADFIGDACVLLAEQQADGSFGIRAVLRNEGLVSAAFVALYGKQKEMLTKAKAEVKAANDADGAVVAAKSA